MSKRNERAYGRETMSLLVCLGRLEEFFSAEEGVKLMLLDANDSECIRRSEDVSVRRLCVCDVIVQWTAFDIFGNRWFCFKCLHWKQYAPRLSGRAFGNFKRRLYLVWVFQSILWGINEQPCIPLWEFIFIFIQKRRLAKPQCRSVHVWVTPGACQWGCGCHMSRI